LRIVVREEIEHLTPEERRLLSAEEASGRKWDFGTFKYHPLWDPENPRTEDDIQAITVGGEPLFRGTSSEFVDEDGLHPHPLGAHGGHQEVRIYMSEGAEDAEGYSCIAAEEHGGVPLLCAVKVTEELFNALKPGYEGLGEWYVDWDKIPKGGFTCRRVREGVC
jgi:hypothetical protein